MKLNSENAKCIEFKTELALNHISMMFVECLIKHADLHTGKQKKDGKKY